MMWFSLTGDFMVLWIIISAWLLQLSHETTEMDNEFAEFEDIEVDEIGGEEEGIIRVTSKEVNKVASNKVAEDDDGSADEDDDEFVDDEEEFLKLPKKDHLEEAESRIPQQLRFADVFYFHCSCSFFFVFQN